ncbi:MAG: hypothetical protein NTX50_21765 [Candidatus Sumerlaeota bacterium]|nr:hypothetical protein [Candidatus Sumerlaeota bacterium]
MIIGIHPDEQAKDNYSEKWERFLRARGVETRALDLLAPDALDQARGCDGVMWRWLHTPQDKQSAQRILFVIERCLKIPVFPNVNTSWHFDEKIAQFYLLEALGAPMPKTWLFWDRERAESWARKAAYPVVFKFSSGAGSANVILVNSAAQAMELIQRAFTTGCYPYLMNEYRRPRGLELFAHPLEAAMRARDSMRYIWSAEYPLPNTAWWKPERGYAYFQEFLPGNTFDTRISVIGNRAFGFRRFNRGSDFRASGSGDLSTDPAAVDQRCIRTAFQISQRGEFQSMAYDFLLKDGVPVIVEISYGFVDSAVQSCQGHWELQGAADNGEIVWKDGAIWPEEAQVEDFLQAIASGSSKAK